MTEHEHETVLVPQKRVEFTTVLELAQILAGLPDDGPVGIATACCGCHGPKHGDQLRALYQSDGSVVITDDPDVKPAPLPRRVRPW